MREPSLKKKKSGLRSCFAILVFLLVVAAAVGLFAVNWYNGAIYSPNSSATDEVNVKVEEGDTLSSIAPALEEKGLIKSKDALRIYLRINSIDVNIKAGNYAIAKNKTVIEIIDILEEGVQKPGVRVTLKEGLRHEQIGDLISDALGSDTFFSLTEFNSIVEAPDEYTFTADIQTFLDTYKPEGKILEGFLYPDTYEFAADQTTMQIIEKMLENFIIKVNLTLTLSNLDLEQTEVTNLYDGIILASIIEKEASRNDDRKEISAVFHNRLKDDYLLESDATVNYITGKNDPGVNLSDLQIDDPYNTYKYTGLPPTPIVNPRIESIVAALYPNITNNYFFFHSDSGETYYSETLSEHSTKVCEIRGCE